MKVKLSSRYPVRKSGCNEFIRKLKKSFAELETELKVDYWFLLMKAYQSKAPSKGIRH